MIQEREYKWNLWWSLEKWNLILYLKCIKEKKYWRYRENNNLILKFPMKMKEDSEVSAQKS